MIVTEEEVYTVPFHEAFLPGTGDIQGEVIRAASHQGIQGIQGGAILGVSLHCLGRAQGGASRVAFHPGEGKAGGGEFLGIAILQGALQEVIVHLLDLFQDLLLLHLIDLLVCGFPVLVTSNCEESI